MASSVVLDLPCGCQVVLAPDGHVVGYSIGGGACPPPVLQLPLAFSDNAGRGRGDDFARSASYLHSLPHEVFNGFYSGDDHGDQETAWEQDPRD